MSSLAFNLNGERFDPPPEMAFWRVRRLKPGGRGVPEVIFDNDGLPLVVAADIGIEEFRSAVRNAPGRYRLDPVDVDQRSCESGAPAYVQLEGGERSSSAHVIVDGDDRDLLQSVIQANTEMAKLITERFAAVMESAAALLAAADGAGMPRRKAPPSPPIVEVRNVAEEPDDGGGGDELATVLKSAVDKAMPLLGHTINTKLLGLSPSQSIALLSGAPPPATEPEAEPDDDDDPEERNNFVEHLAAIEKRLEPGEVALVRTAIAQMSPATRATWSERLMSRSLEGAVELIRDEIARRRQT